MQKTVLALLISLSALTVSSFAVAKDVTYGEQKIILSDSISPGNDFYQYVNQDWIAHTKIPAGMSRINSFVELYLKTEKQLQALINKLEVQPESELNHNQRNIRNLYRSYLNETAVEKTGLTPVQNALNAIKQAKTHADITNLMAKPGYMPFISYWVGLDAKVPDTYVLYLGQGGLGLPNRNYYLDNTKQMETIRHDYVAYIATILHLAGEGEKEAQLKAKQIFALEKSLAKVHWTPEAERDTLKNYHPMTLSQLKKFTPDYQWQGFIQQWKLSDEQLAKVIVENDSAVEQLAKILANTPLSTLQDYLVFHYLSSKANYLNQAFSDARFNFYSTRLNGIKQQRSRKERALEVVNKLQGEPLGQLYVATYFDPDAKNKIQNLVSYVKGTFKTRLQNNDWMDKRTCQEALKKLNQFTVKIGYPEKWHDFSTLHLQPDTLFDNYLQVQNWLYQDNMSRIGEKVRKWEWGMTPQTINAYYNPVQNEIVFPAAILQAPFFDQNADPAYNYGAIGAVLGHEMGHGFDDQGRLYDGTGQLRNWWSTASQQHFKEKTAKLIKQYNWFKIDGLAVNGKLTLGENIGDLGGLNIALNAYKQFSKEHYPNGEPPIIDGMTGLQRFFIAWARTWRELANKESERNKIMADPHSPNPYRANGVVRNMDDWYAAFNVEKEHKLYLAPKDRIHIW